MLRALVLIALAGCNLFDAPHHLHDAALACGGGCDAPWSTCNGDRAGACSGDVVCTYPSDAGRPDVCSCTDTGWRCSNCPADFMDPAATCSPGDGCSYEDWEHGCSCVCNPQGKWACANETVGSMCPSGMIDAGVD
jgi:hypothetical protein